MDYKDSLASPQELAEQKLAEQELAEQELAEQQLAERKLAEKEQLLVKILRQLESVIVAY